jgi:hypothetical protein
MAGPSRAASALEERLEGTATDRYPSNSLARIEQAEAIKPVGVARARDDSDLLRGGARWMWRRRGHVRALAGFALPAGPKLLRTGLYARCLDPVSFMSCSGQGDGWVGSLLGLHTGPYRTRPGTGTIHASRHLVISRRLILRPLLLHDVIDGVSFVTKCGAPRVWFLFSPLF